MPCYGTMRETLIPAKKRATKECIERELRTIPSLCAHIDIWSSKKMDGYLGISITGIKSDLTLFNKQSASQRGRTQGFRRIRLFSFS